MNDKTGLQNDTTRRASSLGVAPSGRLSPKVFAILALTFMLTTPFVSATDPAGEPAPGTTSLVLNAATPSNPIVAYTEGTEPLAEVRLLNVAPMAGGFTITDPTGVDRFTNQFSNEAGVVVFFDVYWGRPHGDWIVTHKPGLPAISPEPKPGEPDDPAFDPANFASEVLLTFNIDPLRIPHKVAYETGEGTKGAVAATSESVGAIAVESAAAAREGVQELREEYPVAVDPVVPEAEIPQGLLGNNWTNSGGWGQPCRNNCGDGGYYGGTHHIGPPDYTFCAYEGEWCSFDGTYDVAYGNHGYYYYRYNVEWGIDCTSEEFGDPYYDVYKACYIKPAGGGGSGGTTYVGPPDYSFCAYQDQYCSFTGTRYVAYGNHGYYYYIYGVANGIDCTDNNFGDPYYGIYKACYVSNSGSSTQTGCTNWQLQANHWKWVNLVVTHAPLDGFAIAGAATAGATDVYLFGNGVNSQTFVAATLEAADGETAGLYALMGAAYYTCEANRRVVLTEFEGYRENKHQSLYGASRATDSDDLSDFWGFSAVVGGDVKSISLYHQYQGRDNGITTEPSGQICIESKSTNGEIYGLDISVSFGSAGSTVGGDLKYTASKSSTMSYKYCFGNSHSYNWDNLGGTSEERAKAFHTNW